ncbi:SIR2 family protein [Rhodococcus zopfii]|uniref:SIR2 family protein n=1 Tax=Rhodococcus zopfii TaxID=43772 RepID=UPI0011110B72|nr:SIR2 family protein [Rhodococcus zopfii]
MTNLPDPAIAEALLPLAFSLHDDPGTYALIAGAGISFGAVPVAWEVFTDLIIRIAQTHGTELHRDTAESWYQKQFSTEPTYEGVLEQLGPTPAARKAILREAFEPGGQLPKPTNAHRAVAQLMKAGAIQIVVTMNFDRLFEQALRDEDVEPEIVATEAAATAIGPLHQVRACIIHLHGEYKDSESMRNTIDELSAYPPRMQALIDQIASEYGLIIAGWSAEYDPVLRSTIETHYPRRYRAVRIDPFDLKDKAREALTRLQGTPIRASADEAFSHLADAVNSLATRHARNPLTLPVAIDTAKRELSGGHTAISLHDRLHAEFRRLHNLEDLSRTDGTDDEYMALVARLEEASAVAVGLVAVLAYWGTADTDRWWIDEIARFAHVTPASSSNTAVWKARRVIGNRLLYAAEIGAVAARRYETFRDLAQLTTPSYISRGDHDSVFEVCAANTTYECVPGSTRQHYEQLQPILERALSLTHDALDSAWQRFELLRLTTVLLAHPDFEAKQTEYLDYQAAYGEWKDQNDDGQGAPTEQSQQPAGKQEAWVNMDRALGDLARLITVDNLHLLTRDTSGFGGPWTSPLIERWKHILDTGAEHPILAAVPTNRFSDIFTALEGVDACLDMQTQEHVNTDFQHKKTTSPPDEVWLDVPILQQ